MNKYEPVSSGLFSVLLQDAAFDGTLFGTLSIELGKLLPPGVVASVLSLHRRDGGLRTVIHPPQAAGAPQRITMDACAAERAVEGTVYLAGRDGQDQAQTGTDSHLRLVLRSTRKGRSELELGFPVRRGEQLRQELARLLGSIGPDLVLAFRIAELLERASIAERLNDTLLELLPFAALLLDRRGGVRRANALGSALLVQGGAVILGPDGRIHAVNHAENGNLRDVLERRQDKRSGAAGLTCMVSAPAGKDPLLITARSLGGPSELRGDPALVSREDEEPATMLLAQRTGGELTVRPEILQGAYGLTSKEAELAQSLLNGESIGTYAQRRRMSKQTLRNQLSGILRKTGTARQAELIGLLTRLAFAPSI